ncbi:hypothetical protein PM082_023848 [Marasmius tenuissimus]|nr:hypothetical protein PM082_023848 [Marasmius tenuissimus]
MFQISNLRQDDHASASAHQIPTANADGAFVVAGTGTGANTAPNPPANLISSVPPEMTSSGHPSDTPLLYDYASDTAVIPTLMATKAAVIAEEAEDADLQS